MTASPSHLRVLRAGLDHAAAHPDPDDRAALYETALVLAETPDEAALVRETVAQDDGLAETDRAYFAPLSAFEESLLAEAHAEWLTTEPSAIETDLAAGWDMPLWLSPTSLMHLDVPAAHPAPILDTRAGTPSVIILHPASGDRWRPQEGLEVRWWDSADVTVRETYVLALGAWLTRALAALAEREKNALSVLLCPRTPR